MPKGRLGSMRKEDAAYRRYLKAEAKREKAQMAALRRADARRNPARGGRKFGLTVAQLRRIANSGKRVRFKSSGKNVDVYFPKKRNPTKRKRKAVKRTTKRKAAPKRKATTKRRRR